MARYRVTLLDYLGATTGGGILNPASIGPVTEALNDHGSGSFTLHLSDRDVALVRATKHREVQVSRDADDGSTATLLWGPIVDPYLSGDTLVCPVRGASWWLEGRTVGPVGGPTNRLVNGSFEQGFTRVVTDGVTTNTSTTLTSATAAFVTYDVGLPISGTGIPAGTTIASRTNATTVVLSQAATATNTGVTVTIGPTGNWAFAKTTPIRTFTTFTQADARADVLPAEEVTIIAVGGVTGYADRLALRLYGPDMTGIEDDGDIFAWQDIAITTGDRPVTATLSGRVWMSDALTVVFGPYYRGLMLGRLPSTYTTTGANGGHDGWYADNTLDPTDGFIEWEASRVDEKTPLNQWVRQEATVVVPANSTEILHARLCGASLIYFDDIALRYDDALEFAQTDAPTIIDGIVAHAQDVATYGKDALNIDTFDMGATPGPDRNLRAYFADQADCWSLILGLTRLEAGVDVQPVFSQTARTLVVASPNLGTTRGTDYALWMPGNVARLDSWSLPTSQAASDVTSRANNFGGTDWGSATDRTGFARMRQATISAEIEANIDDLDEDAAEHQAASATAETFSVTLIPSWTDKILTETEVGDWFPCNIVAGGLSIVGTYRCVARTWDPAGDTVSLTLTIRPTP